MAAATLVAAMVGLLQAEWFALRPRLAAMAQLWTGGLLIATALVHLLADAAARDAGFPWSCALLGVGYCVMVSMELTDVEADESRRLADESAELCPTTKSSPSRTHSHGHDHLGSSVATAALVLHSVGDGAAIALQTSSSKLIAVAAAIVVHKFFAASALGTLLARREGRRRYLMAAVFACATPATILVVVLGGKALSLSEDDGGGDGGGRAVDRATALCAGSLLYVGIHEILLDALQTPAVSRAAKLVLFWTGFSLMALLAVWV